MHHGDEFCNRPVIREKAIIPCRIPTRLERNRRSLTSFQQSLNLLENKRSRTAQYLLGFETAK